MLKCIGLDNLPLECLGLNNLKPEDFNWSNVSSAFLTGTSSVDVWKDQPRNKFDWIIMSLNTSRTVLKAYQLSQRLSLSPSTFYAILFAGALSTLSNAIRLYGFAEDSTREKYLHKVQIKIWTATPALIFITNVALTAFESRFNPVKGLLTFSFMVLTYLDSRNYLISEREEMALEPFKKLLLFAPLGFSAVRLYDEQTISRGLMVAEAAFRLYHKK